MHSNITEKQTYVPVCGVRITRKFSGSETLGDMLVPLLQNQVDNLIQTFYHTTRANTATSQANQTGRDELS